MLKITAGLADGILVDLRGTLTGLDETSVGPILKATRHASGGRQFA